MRRLKVPHPPPKPSTALRNWLPEKMKNAIFGRNVSFVSAPRNKAKNAFHIVIVFNGIEPLTERAMYESDVSIKLGRPCEEKHLFHFY